MARIEELNDSGIRVVYDDDGDISSLIDQRGRQMNIPLSKSDKITGGNRFIESLVRNPDGIISGNITRDSNGAVTSAAVKFPDGTDGTYTALVLSSAFPGAVDSYSVTYGDKTYTQPAVTRDSSGSVTVRPDLEVS